MKILFEDRVLLVVEKPAGIAAQPDKTGCEDLLSEAAAYLGKEPHLVHRLDRPVQGIMIFGKERGDISFQKEYLAVCCGNAPESGELIDYLVKNQRLNISRVAQKNTPGAKECRLRYKKLLQTETEEDGVLSLLSIELLTGRHHQIRVQLQNAKMPLWGDTKYNPAFARPKAFVNVALCAYKVILDHPKTGEALQFCVSPSEYPFTLF